MYLRVLPPDGRVIVSAPHFISENEIEAFCIAHHHKISNLIEKVRERGKNTIDKSPDYVAGEKHFLLGHEIPLILKKIDTGKTEVRQEQDTLCLYIREGSKRADRERAIYHFYYEILEQIVPKIIEKWEDIWQVSVCGYAYRHQKTLWGSCNFRTRKISLNIELAKVPIECIEYVIAHELLHIKIPSHGTDFKNTIAQQFPNWKALNVELKKFAFYFC